jgi:hypothetical protein
VFCQLSIVLPGSEDASEVLFQLHQTKQKSVRHLCIYAEVVYMQQNKHKREKRLTGNTSHQSPLMRPLPSLSIPQPRHLLMADTPQTPRHTNNTADQRQVVRTRIALPPLATDQLALATLVPSSISAVGVRVLVQNAAVDEVEDVSRNDRSHSHSAPVNAHTRWAESIRDESGVDAEESAIRQTRKPREKKQLIRILKRKTHNLRRSENASRAHKRPEARSVVVDEPVRANPRGQAADEGAERNDADVHKLALLDKVAGDGVVVVVPEGLGDVSDVVDGHEADAAEEAEHDEELPEFGGFGQGEAGNVGVVVVGVMVLAVGDVAWEGGGGGGDEGGCFVGVFCCHVRGTSNPSGQQGLTIIIFSTVIAVASPIPTPRPHQWVAIGPFVTRTLACRHSLVRRARWDDPQEQHTSKHHAERANAQKQQQASRVVRESNTRDKSEQESAQAESAQRKRRRRSPMARPIGGTRLDRSAESTAAPNTGQEAKEAQQADRVSLSTSLVCAVQREVSASQADAPEKHPPSRTS